jgi:hypothetical protein
MTQLLFVAREILVTSLQDNQGLLQRFDAVPEQD